MRDGQLVDVAPSAQLTPVKFWVYVISGVCSGLAGVILTARLWSAQPNSGGLLELYSIAAAILGGTSSIGGSLAGAFIGALSNGLNILQVGSYFKWIRVNLAQSAKRL